MQLVVWAQRSSETEEEKNIVYLSVNAIDLQHPKVELTETGLIVEGVQRETNAFYKVDLEFYENINVEVCIHNVYSLALVIIYHMDECNCNFVHVLTR